MARGEIVGALLAPVPSTDEPERRSSFMVDTKCELARLEFNSMCVSVDARRLALLREHGVAPRRRGEPAEARRFRARVVVHDVRRRAFIRRAVRR